MASRDDILFHIGHVENANEARRLNYKYTHNRLSAVYKELMTESVYLPSIEMLVDLKEEFPFVKFQQVVHHHLYDNSGSYLLSDGKGGVYTDIGFPLWSGEIGLLLSLYRGFKKFLETDKQYLLWLEDDLTIEDDFAEIIDEALAAADFPHDFLSLTVPMEVIHHYELYLKEFADFGNPVFCRPYQVNWAGAVLVSRSGALKFTIEAEQEGFRYPWDWMIYNVRSYEAPMQNFYTAVFNPWIRRPFDTNPDCCWTSTITNREGHGKLTPEDFSRLQAQYPQML